MTRVFTLLFLLYAFNALGQQAGSFKVRGDFDKFYPVTFQDGGWARNIGTDLEIGRSNVHEDGDWKGSVISKFRFHNTEWGNGSRFVEADIMQFNNVLGRPEVLHRAFIAGWKDATMANGASEIVIWLRGGNISYYFNSNAIVNPKVYDGVQNPLPFAEQNGPLHTYKTDIDTYVNSNGLSYENTAYFTSPGNSYFAGNLGIGINKPTAKLHVEGDIRANEIKVLAPNWPDYVFEPDYNLLKIEDLKDFIDKHKHLPGIPSALEINRDGVTLGDMNVKLLKKIEELTLYLLQKDEELKNEKARNEHQQKQLDLLQSQIDKILISLKR